LWVATCVPVTALAGGVALGVVELQRDTSGPFDLALGPWVMGTVGACWGGIWALVLAAPHFYGLRWLLKVCAAFERRRLSILVALVPCTLPQALLAWLLVLVSSDNYAVLATPVFLLAWGSILLGLWLPRALLPILRPGALDVTRDRRQDGDRAK
jgi:hypothetical protein